MPLKRGDPEDAQEGQEPKDDKPAGPDGGIRWGGGPEADAEGHAAKGKFGADERGWRHGGPEDRGQGDEPTEPGGPDKRMGR